jgi:hypothetical protein
MILTQETKYKRRNISRKTTMKQRRSMKTLSLSQKFSRVYSR